MSGRGDERKAETAADVYDAFAKRSDADAPAYAGRYEFPDGSVWITPGLTKREHEMIEYRKAYGPAVFRFLTESPGAIKEAAAQKVTPQEMVKMVAAMVEEYARAMYAAAHPDSEEQNDE